MTEFNKIIRYIIPVFILVGYTFCFVSLGLMPEHHFYRILADTRMDFTLLVPFAGGLGFLLSILHHYAFWKLPFYPKTKYATFFQSQEIKKLITFNGVDINKVTEEDLWRIINIIWHRLRQEDPAHEKVNSRNDSLTDLMHGNGTTLIALMLSGLLAIFYLMYFFNAHSVHFAGVNIIFPITSLVTFILLLLLHIKIYCFSITNLNRFVETTLNHTLAVRALSKNPGTNKANGPLQFYFPPGSD